MIIAVATGTGLQKEIQGKLIGFTGHIQISKFDLNTSYENAPVSIVQDFYPEMNLDGFTHIQKFATKAGILKSRDAFEGVVLKGISDDYSLDYLKSVMKKGAIPAFGRERNDSILISNYLAKLLTLSVGDTAKMFFMREAPKPPRVRNFVVAGIYETGLEDIDHNYIIGDFEQIRRLNRWEKSQAGGFEVFIDDFNKIDERGEFLTHEIPFDLNAETLKRKNEKIFQWLDLFDMNIYIIIIIMVLVASLNMIMALFIIILERTHLIGVLKTLGASNLSIRNIFLRQSTRLIFKGMFLGNLFGLAFCYIQKYFGFIKLDQTTYYVTEVPIDINWLYIAGINLGVFISCMLAMMLPSLLVTRIKPVKVLRFD
jgi:lipoprotein-releasing system permease protein